uniref:Uncharacterized protein n=1 Tax=Scytonema sp. PCC 10023 TaxID=1680591 RepID=A0A0K0PD76_9CYAN|nr:hypothetical protein [Scytonema sp. PCC 10023]
MKNNMAKIYVATCSFCFISNRNCLKSWFLHREWLMFELSARLLKASHGEVLAFFGDV